jgi:hypothetical protein
METANTENELELEKSKRKEYYREYYQKNRNKILKKKSLSYKPKKDPKSKSQLLREYNERRVKLREKEDLEARELLKKYKDNCKFLYK